MVRFENYIRFHAYLYWEQRVKVKVSGSEDDDWRMAKEALGIGDEVVQALVDRIVREKYPYELSPEALAEIHFEALGALFEDRVFVPADFSLQLAA